LQAKDLWPPFRELTERLRGSVSDPRVAVEYSPEHERAGSIRMYETLPFFTGRSTLEGVYNQASLNTHAVYYLASELGERSPNPFRNVEFSSFDTDAAIAHLRLFAADTIVVLSDKLQKALAARSDVERVATIHPYTVFRLREAPPYVEPLRLEPVRSSPQGWREKAMRWFARVPPPAPLVFTDDPRFGTREEDIWLQPPEVPIAGAEAVAVESSVGTDSIEIRTNRPGHPLLVKASYHPRWRAVGGDGPYLVSPALMLVIPREPRMSLRYGADSSDRIGRLASVAGVVILFLLARSRRRSTTSKGLLPLRIRLALFGEAPPARRWGGLVPGVLLALLFASRALPSADAARRRAEGEELVRLARQARANLRPADAAEYARWALSRVSDASLRAELLALRAKARQP
jgi:hypothetical protein